MKWGGMGKIQLVWITLVEGNQKSSFWLVTKPAVFSKAGLDTGICVLIRFPVVVPLRMFPCSNIHLAGGQVLLVMLGPYRANMFIHTVNKKW